MVSYLQCNFVADGLGKHEGKCTWPSDSSHGEYADNDVWCHMPTMGWIPSESRLGSATGGDEESHPYLIAMNDAVDITQLDTCIKRKVLCARSMSCGAAPNESESER